MPVWAELAHDLPGRTRFRVPSRRRDGAWFVHLERQFATIDGVHEVRTDARTGSVLVLHDLTADALAARARDAGLFELRPSGPAPEAAGVVRELRRGFERLDERLSRATGGVFDLGAAWVVFLSGAAVVQALRRELLPAAVTLVAYVADRLERPPGERR
jgi:hypothetical protein